MNRMWESTWYTNEQVQEYETISSSDPHEVEKQVNARIDEGWEPHGELIYSKRHEIFVQAMVKTATVTIN